jgi:hypothetical protein
VHPFHEPFSLESGTRLVESFAFDSRGMVVFIIVDSRLSEGEQSRQSVTAMQQVRHVTDAATGRVTVAMAGHIPIRVLCGMCIHCQPPWPMCSGNIFCCLVFAIDGVGQQHPLVMGR